MSSLFQIDKINPTGNVHSTLRLFWYLPNKSCTSASLIGSPSCEPCGLPLPTANFYIPTFILLPLTQYSACLRQALTREPTRRHLCWSAVLQDAGGKKEKNCKKVKRGPYVSVCLFSLGRPWRGSFVIRDLINRWRCCAAFPGRELLPWQPHHKHCR